MNGARSPRPGRSSPGSVRIHARWDGRPRFFRRAPGSDAPPPVRPGLRRGGTERFGGAAAGAPWTGPPGQGRDPGLSARYRLPLWMGLLLHPPALCPPPAPGGWTSGGRAVGRGEGPLQWGPGAAPLLRRFVHLWVFSGTAWESARAPGPPEPVQRPRSAPDRTPRLGSTAARACGPVWQGLQRPGQSRPQRAGLQRWHPGPRAAWMTFPAGGESSGFLALARWADWRRPRAVGPAMGFPPLQALWAFCPAAGAFHHSAVSNANLPITVARYVLGAVPIEIVRGPILTFSRVRGMGGFFRLASVTTPLGSPSMNSLNSSVDYGIFG